MEKHANPNPSANARPSALGILGPLTARRAPRKNLLPEVGDVKQDSNLAGSAALSLSSSFRWLVDGSQALASALDEIFPAIRLAGADAANTEAEAGRMEKYAYNKGDDARSIEEYASAVTKEYSVFSNKNCRDPEKFNQKVIMVYGEIHTDPLIPSIRSGKGALLLESADLNRCLKKHSLHKENICANIDKFDPNALIKQVAALMGVLKGLIGQLDRAESARIEELDRQHAEGSVYTILNAMIEFVHYNYDSISAAEKSPSVRNHLEETRLAYERERDKFNQMVATSVSGRDVGMAEEAKKVIAAQKPGETATIIVGGLHVKGVFNYLAKEFPDHAAVACYAKKHLALLNGNERKQLVAGIQAQFVSPKSAVKQEL